MNQFSIILNKILCKRLDPFIQTMNKNNNSIAMTK